MHLQQNKLEVNNYKLLNWSYYTFVVLYEQSIDSLTNFCRDRAEIISPL